MKKETFTVALPNGKRYDGLTLERAKDILCDEGGFSCGYVTELVRKATTRDRPGVDIEWLPTRQKSWQIDGIRMSQKAAMFALEFKGFSKEEAQFLLSAARLCADARKLTKANEEKTISQLYAHCRNWLRENKSRPRAGERAE